MRLAREDPALAKITLPGTVRRRRRSLSSSVAAGSFSLRLEYPPDRDISSALLALAVLVQLRSIAALSARSRLL